MVKRKRRGPIAKPLRNLCSGTLLDPANKPQFKDGLSKIVDENPSFLRQIGMVIQAWAVEFGYDIDEIWQLVDEVEPKIRQQYIRWAKEFFEAG